MKRIFLLLLLLKINLPLFSDSLKVDPYRLAGVIGVSAGIVTIAHLQQYNSWWKGEMTSFHFRDDFGEVLNADKFGHAYFSFLISDIFWRSLHWAGVKKEKALLLGAFGSLLFQTYVEIEDGFHPNLGFSTSDEISNIAGAFFPYLREKLSLEFINFKISLFPSEKFKSGAHRFIVDDYESMFFWLCFDPSKLHKTKSWLIDFFDIAVGHGVKGTDWKGNGTREIFISLDYDFSRIPVRNEILKTFLHILNYYHFPAPAFQISPKIKFHAVKF